MAAFLDRVAPGAEQRRELFCEARYADQLWELSLPLGDLTGIEGPDDVQRLRARFDALHAQLFSVEQSDVPVEILHLRGEARALRPRPELLATGAGPASPGTGARREVWLAGRRVGAAVHAGSALAAGERVEGPAIIEEPTTTLVLPPGSCATVRPTHYWIEPGDSHAERPR